MLARMVASSRSERIFDLWCFAVSVGTKPVPALVMCVRRMFDRILVPCIMPMPILLALPSIPRTIRVSEEWDLMEFMLGDN